MNVPYINRKIIEVDTSIQLCIEYIESTFYSDKPFRISELSSLVIAAKSGIEEITNHMEEKT